jgi:hypothetical protein
MLKAGIPWEDKDIFGQRIGAFGRADDQAGGHAQLGMGLTESPEAGRRRCAGAARGFDLDGEENPVFFQDDVHLRPSVGTPVMHVHGEEADLLADVLDHGALESGNPIGGREKSTNRLVVRRKEGAL